MNNMKLILGTMTFGPQVDLTESKDMLDLFLAEGYREIDSAYVYNNGRTEEMLGVILRDHKRESYSIASKVNPRITGKLDRNAIELQLNGSLQRMELEYLDTFYLHMPDQGTAIEETLEACAEMHALGKFKELGVSNYPAWMVAHIWHLCDREGWPKPRVYQGMYNALSRSVEQELFEALRALGILFYAYNPLAGGLLSGRYSNFKDEPGAGRFTLRPNYKDRYWKESYFDAVIAIGDVCQQHDIRLAEAALRWVARHSSLLNSQSDGLIVGVSSIAQLQQNIDAVRHGPLPDEVIETFAAAWGKVKADSPEYFRG